MVTIKVKADFNPVRALLTGMQKQLAFATAKALTMTANDVSGALRGEMERVFDKPATFTIRQGVGITSARKTDLRAAVFLKRKQAEYLQAQIAGGKRRRRPFEAQFAKEQQGNIATAVPGRGAVLNAQGNLSKATIAKLGREARTKKRGGVFYATLRDGVSAIFKRKGRNITPVLVFTSERATYRRRFDFFGVARKTVAANWQRNFDSALRSAIATAR
jgi:hypothetical protein